MHRDLKQKRIERQNTIIMLVATFIAGGLCGIIYLVMMLIS